ncbi:MAG: alpha/beta hydrolase [Sphingopyxis terrae]|nr:alpha/beta hydrolase [Sphingopyxis terrae]
MGHRLVVAIHGSSRGVAAYRDALTDFAKRERCVILAPLFPIGPLGDGNGDGYKFLVEGDIRYDTVLLKMIEEIEGELGYGFGPILLSGFSGGGQFAHRFFYAHPERLLAASIGAPGIITRIDPLRDYWLGTRNWETIFGRPIDVEAMRRVPVRILVGEHDAKPLGFGPFNLSPEDIERIGRTRLERSAFLAEDFQGLGIDVERVVMPGVGHEGLKSVPATEAFFGELLGSVRSGSQ